MTDYLLDTNVFIEAKDNYYGFDFCPAFWDWLIEQNHSGKVASVEKVEEELLKGNDYLAEWAGERGSDFFLKSDDTVQSVLNKVSDWAENNIYLRHAITTFLDGADYWLVAHALAHNCIVVTRELPADTPSRIKIPNACIGLGLRYANPYEMLRAERARFVLRAKRSDNSTYSI